MSTAWLLLPDFVLIALGYLLVRWTAFDRPLWDDAERLVYYLLFPVLLFVAIVRQPISLGHAGRPGTGRPDAHRLRHRLGLRAGPWPGVDARAHASVRRWHFASTPTSRWRWPNAWVAPPAWLRSRC